MTIGINTLYLVPNQVGGTEYLLRSFLKALEAIPNEHTFIVFCNRENAPTLSFSQPNWQKVVCPVRAQNRLARICYEQLVLPQLVQQYQCKMLHSFGYLGPAWGRFKKVLTVHDVNWKDCPEDTGRLQNLVLSGLMHTSLSSADQIITDSDFSYQRLSSHFPQHKQKVAVIYPGIDPTFIEQLKQRNKRLMSNRYVLCVSALYPHKNIPYLLNVWEKLPNVSSHKLVLVGKNGADFKKVEKSMRNLDSVIWHKKIAFNQLVALYQHADLFISPSTYEGFGFPVYEALTAGVPTIVGNTQLYHPKIQPALTELTFDVDIDAELITKALQNQKRVTIATHFLTYSHAAKTLLTLYEQVGQ